MSVILVGVSWAGLLSGWLLLHWLVLGVLSIGIAIVSLSVGRWDLLLIPKLFGILALFQISFLIGAAARSWWDERTFYKDRTQYSANTILDGERVLVIEDDPLTAALLAGEIEGALGVPIGPAGSVAHALREIQDGRVEAAVLDLGLSDGSATCVAMELMDRGVPFVIVSARSTPSEILQRDPGVAVFRKPVPLAAAIQTLAREIRHSRQHGPAAAARH
jgi:CheY-like chemotaxis protein